MIIEKKMWDDLRHSLSSISMPLMAHQQVQSILSNIENAVLQAELNAQLEQYKSKPNGAGQDVFSGEPNSGS
jgi:hypothetical protein